MAFEPMTLQHIEEGEFLVDLEVALKRVQEELIAYRAAWGSDAEKERGQIDARITLECVNADDGLFAVVTKINSKTPSRPPRVTTAFVGDRSRRLMVRASGSSSEPPEQAVLCTRDGRAVDAETGQVVREMGGDGR